MEFDNHRIFGTDISYGQGYPPKFPVTDFVKMRNAGMRFTILKASQANYPDPSFVYNRAAVDGVLPWHSYHYYDNFVDARVQADRFWATNEDNPPQLMWLDLEDRRAAAFRGLNYWYNFLERLKYISKYPESQIGIYTGIAFWKEETAKWDISAKNYFKRYPLWLANYWVGQEQNPPFPVIEVPLPWTDDDVLILQSGTPVRGIELGVSSLEIDFNIFNGGDERFKRYFTPAGEIPPTQPPAEPPEVEEPAKIVGTAKKTAQPSIRIRRAAANGDVNPAGGVIDGILPGQTFEGDRKMQDAMGTIWIRLTKVNNRVLPEKGWSAGFLLDWKDVQETPDPPVIIPPPADDDVFVHVVWDDQNPDYNYKCRTQMPRKDPIDSDNPPAVMRFYPEPKEKMGDFRVIMNNPDWKPEMVRVNGGGAKGLHAWRYLIGKRRATYNKTGWPKQAYITFCGQRLKGKFVEVTNAQGKKEKWFRFHTLKRTDVSRASSMTIQNRPDLVHRFTCVTWDRKNKTTKRINSTGTPRGDVFFFLATEEGVGYIPARHVVP